MNIDIKTQRILWQLNNFYSTHSEIESDVTLSRQYSPFLMDKIYDLLSSEGIKISYSKEINDKLKVLAKEECLHEHAGWVKAFKGNNHILKETARELIQIEMKKFYKTYLVRKYLFELLKNENKVMKILNSDTNEELLAITFISKK